MTGVPKNIARGFRQIEEFRSNWYEAGLSIALKIDFEFYELIAEETLLGRVHSTRRTLILDEICAALAVARALPPGSRILEVGAHAGYLSMSLARETGHTLIAEDISPRAIALAQRKGAGIETFAARVRDYRQWEGPAENFDLVIACYAANKMAAASLKAYCAKQLRPGGFLLLVGEGFEPVFQDPAGFTLLDIDLVGGLDSSGEFPQWIFDPLLLLQKVDSGLFPEDHDYAASCYVHGFRYYASTPETPNGKKTQAWYNATACTPEAH